MINGTVLGGVPILPAFLGRHPCGVGHDLRGGMPNSLTGAPRNLVSLFREFSFEGPIFH